MQSRTSARNTKQRPGSTSNPAGVRAPEPHCHACAQEPDETQAAGSTHQIPVGARSQEACPGTDCDATESVKIAPDGFRLLPVRSAFPPDLPITAKEIHMVLTALGPEFAVLFAEDK